MATKSTSKKAKRSPIREDIAKHLLREVMKTDGCWDRSLDSELSKTFTTLWNNHGQYCSVADEVGRATFLKMSDAVIKFIPPVILEAPSARALLLGEEAA